jgi:hypothetical protein
VKNAQKQCFFAFFLFKKAKPDKLLSKLQADRQGRSARQATGDRRQATGDRRQATGDRRQATGDRRQATGDRRQATLYPSFKYLSQLSNSETKSLYQFSSFSWKNAGYARMGGYRLFLYAPWKLDQDQRSLDWKSAVPLLMALFSYQF